MIARQASSNSTSDRPILKPISRRSSSSASGTRVATPPSMFEHREATPEPSSTVHEGARSTPSSTPFVFGAPQSPFHSFDPDTPVPSVEREVSADSDQQSPASTVRYTPLQSSEVRSTAQDVDPEASLRGISGLGELRLNTPQPPPSPTQRASRTPPIHVTYSPPVNVTGGSRSDRSESLVARVAAMGVDSQQVGSLSPAGANGRRSPSRRPRSSSGAQREIHQVESEEPPDVFARMLEVQEALSNARELTGRIRALLSSSTMTHEHGSSIQALHNQAVTLDEFQLPSSRIIGLVGDSGAGKSSLINSLLDKSELARAVSNHSACCSSSANLI